VQDRQQEALRQTKGQQVAVMTELGQLDYMSKLLVKQLSGETGKNSSIHTLKELASEALTDLQTNMETIKGDIRKERRRFLDSNPQTSPSIGGIYFTKVADNQVLIAFLSCFGAFLLFTSALVIMGKIPIDALVNASSTERLITVGSAWAIAIIFTFVGFFVFT